MHNAPTSTGHIQIASHGCEVLAINAGFLIFLVVVINPFILWKLLVILPSGMPGYKLVPIFEVSNLAMGTTLFDVCLLGRVVPFWRKE